MTSRPPKCSARVTTPSGIDIQALMRGGASRTESRSIRTSSVDPPPMSNRMAPRPEGSSSGEQPITASAASVSRSMTSSRMPVSAATRLRKPSAFEAARQASVAISRSRLAFRVRILSRQTLKAEMARSIAASLMQPVAEMPSPRRTIRENESTTRKPSSVGQAISRRQLLVPRSSAAYTSAPGTNLASAASAATDMVELPGEAASPRSRVSCVIQMSFPGLAADEECRFKRNSSAIGGGATTLTWEHVQSGVVAGKSVVYWGAGREISGKSGHFGFFDARSYVPHLSGKRYCTAKIRRGAAHTPKGG